MGSNLALPCSVHSLPGGAYEASYGFMGDEIAVKEFGRSGGVTTALSVLVFRLHDP